MMLYQCQGTVFSLLRRYRSGNNTYRSTKFCFIDWIITNNQETREISRERRSLNPLKTLYHTFHLGTAFHHTTSIAGRARQRKGRLVCQQAIQSTDMICPFAKGTGISRPRSNDTKRQLTESTIPRLYELGATHNLRVGHHQHHAWVGSFLIWLQKGGTMPCQ